MSHLSGALSRLTAATALICLLSGPALAAPSLDNDAGRWLDTYSDSSGLSAGAVGGQAGQSSVAHDPFGRSITLDDSAASGWFYTARIAPSSFDGWGTVYVAYTSATLNGVAIHVYDGDSAALLGVVPLGPSTDGDYVGMADISSVAGGAASVRLRAVLDLEGQTIKPTVGALSVTWEPRSILNVGLEAPSVKQTGEGIVVRVASSVSYVAAQDFVAYLPAPAPVDNGYGQDAALSYVSSTQGGQWHAGPNPLVLGGVTIPARSVYWSQATLASGNTFAVYATFRSPNGLVNGVSYPFQAFADATNGTAVQSATRSTRVTGTPRGHLRKTSSGTFIVAGQAYTPRDKTVSMRLTAANWYAQPIPSGAQAWLQTYAWDSVQDWLDKGAIDSTGDITNISHQGQVTTTGFITPGGTQIPANSVYWDLSTLTPGQAQSLSYDVTINATVADDLSVEINACSGGALEAKLTTDQQHDSGANSCLDPAQCANIGACHSIIIGVDNAPGVGFAKGDTINGSTGIRGNFNDNADRFVTFGDPITFKLSVGNSGVSALDEVLLIDRVPEGTTFSAASLPGAANGQIWFWTGAASATPPQFFANPLTPADDSIVVGWTQTQPAAASVTWVAYRIPRLRSTYFPDGDPASVIADFRVIVDTAGEVCLEDVVDNTGYVRVSRYTPLDGSEAAVGSSPIERADTERVDVKPIVPNLETSFVTGPASLVPGTSGSWRVTVQNRDRDGNQVDTALTTEAVIPIPTVVANGVVRPLDVLAVSPDGGSLSYELPDRIRVSWPSLLPNQARHVDLTLSLPLGVRNATTITASANLTAEDDFSCAAPSANPSRGTVVASAPALSVVKTVDLTVASSGAAFSYGLNYANTGTAPSTRTWVVDRIPNGAELVSVDVAEGEVWFSDHVPPFDASSSTTGGLPSVLIPDFPFDDAVVRSHFAPGVASAPGTWDAPAGALWVAVLLDDPATAPPIFRVGDAATVTVHVTVNDNAPLGATLENEALIVSDELLQSIGNRVITTVSPRPGLALEKLCPDVVSVGEPVTYTVSWVNDTTNEDDTVALIDTLPEGFVPDLGSLNSTEVPLSVQETVNDNGLIEVTFTFNAQNSLGGGILEFEGEFVGVDSGTFATNTVVGIAENATGAFAVATSCTTLVENPDLFMRKLVDQPEPRSDEVVNYTLIVSNENRRRALDVEITDTLPSGITYVPGALQVTPAGWTIASPEPSAGDTELSFILAAPGQAPGTFPGNSGPVAINLRVQVDTGVDPGTTLTNTVEVTTPTGQDDTFDDNASVDVTTPLPDPAIAITAPLLVKPGESVTWTIPYANIAREDAEGVVVLTSLPEGPNDDNQSDFSYTSHVVPSGTAVWFSDAPLGTAPAVATWNAPGAGWSDTPGAVVNHILFSHGDLDALTGPFTGYITAEAREQDDDLPLAGGTFEACTTIAMIGAPYNDSDESNNRACAVTRTPGVDLAITAWSVPAGGDPGVAPGDAAELVFELENSGTVDVYGVVVDLGISPLATVTGHSAGTVAFTTEDGFEMGPVDTAGGRIDAPVDWTFDGTRFVLGQSGDAQGAHYYRELGMKPGDRVTIRVRLLVDPDALDSTALDHVVVTSAAGRPGDEAEEILDNNTDEAGTVIYRADPFVIKSVENLTGDAGLAEAGDTLRYTLAYGNAGKFASRDTVLADSLPPGVSYVPGSLAGVPPGVAAEYDHGDLSWDQPDDGNTTGVRLRWTDVLPAPANSTFSATTSADFDRGSFEGTAASGGAVIISASEASGGDAVTFPGDLTDYNYYDNWQSLDVLYAWDTWPTPSANIVFQQVMTGSEFSGPTRLTSLSLRSCCDDLVGFDTVELSLGYAAPDLLTDSGYVLHDQLSQNIVKGTEIIVARKSDVSFTATEELFIPGLTFDTPFDYDPSKGDLVLTWRSTAEIRDDENEQYDWTLVVAEDASLGTMRWGDASDFNTDAFVDGDIDPPYGSTAHIRFGTAPLTVPGVGAYLSPTFPDAASEGNVIRWGRAVATSTIGDAETESVTIDVVAPDGQVILADAIVDGTGAVDLSSLSPIDYPQLQLQATLTGVASCTQDIAPEDAAFDGVATGLSESDVIAGYTRARDGFAADVEGAYAWTPNAGVVDLHATFDGSDPGDPTADNAPFLHTRATDINDAHLIVGYGVPNLASDVLTEACGQVVPQVTYGVPTTVETNGGSSALPWPREAHGPAVSTSLYHLTAAGDHFSDGPLPIRGLHYRIANSIPAGDSASFNVRIYLLDSNLTSTPTDHDLSDNPGSVLVYEGPLSATAVDGLDLELYIPLATPFVHQPSASGVVIQWQFLDAPVYSGPAFALDAINNGTLVAGTEERWRQSDGVTRSGWSGRSPVVLFDAAPTQTLTAPNSYEGQPATGGGQRWPTASNDRVQELVDRAQFGDKPLLITGMRLRRATNAVGYSGTITDFRITIDTSSSSAPLGSGDSDTFADNYSTAGTVVFDGDLVVNATQDPDDWDIVIPFDQPAPYDPTQGHLLIDYQLFGGHTFPVDASDWSAFRAQGTNSGSFVQRNAAAADAATSTGTTGNRYAFQLDVVVEEEPVTNHQPVLLWEPDNALDPTLWSGSCLPAPTTNHGEVPQFTGRPHWNAAFVTHGSSPTLVAATWQGGSATTDPSTAGTATVWCEEAQGWAAIPIVDSGENLAPPAYVTGMNDNGWVIGVIEGEGDSGPQGAAWIPDASDGCPSSWTQHDLGSFYPAAIDNRGRVVLAAASQGDVVSGPTGYTTFVGDGFASPTILSDAGLMYAGLDTVGLPGPSYDVMNSDGGFSFFDLTDGNATYVDGEGAVTRFAIDPTRFTVAGLGVNNAGKVLSGTQLADDPTTLQLAVYDAATGAVRYLPGLGDPAAAVPAAINDGDVVVGTTTDDPVEPQSSRVWISRSCGAGETPRLEAWSVSYETDRPPQVTFEVTVDDVCQAEVVNTAEIAGATPQISADNDQSTASIAVNTADLSVSIEADRDVTSPSVEGDYVLYTATLTNDGPGTAKDVAFTVTAPAGTLIEDHGADGAGGGIVVAGEDQVTVHLPSVAPGESVTVDLIVLHDVAVEGALLTASTSVDARTIDCAPGNDVDSATIVVGGFPNLYVDIVGPTYATSGETATYTLTYGNGGNTTATGAVLTHVLPPGVTFVDANLTPTGVTDGVITWEPAFDTNGTPGVFPPGVQGSLTVTVQLPDCGSEGVDGEVEHVATIDGAEPESSLTDNAAATATYIESASEQLALTVTNSHGVVADGEEITITAYFVNSGSRAVGGAVLVVPVPHNAVYVQGSASAGGSEVAGNPTWQLGTLLAGQGGSVTFRAVTVAGEGTPLTATLTALGACPAEALVPMAETRAPGLQLYKSADRGVVCAGQGADVVWTLIVTNTGATDLQSVSVVDTLPQEIAYTAGSIAGLGANDAGAPSTLRWDIPLLPAGAALTLRYSSSVTAMGTTAQVNPATAFVGESEVGSDTLGVVATDCGGAELGLDKAWTGACTITDAPVWVTLTLSHRSERVLRGAVVTDTLPAGMALLDRGEASDYDEASRTLTFTVDALDAGETATFVFGVAPDGAATPGHVFLNRAAVWAPNFVPQTSNQVAGAFLDCDDADVCTADTCDPLVGCVNTLTPIAEVLDDCDGVDNDCDAATDEDFTVMPTSCGVGECAAEGLTACEDGNVTDSCEPGVPTDEVCDGADNDCDGDTDAEDANLTLALCDKQDGVCKGATAPASLCVGGRWEECPDALYAATAFPELYSAGADTTCDGVDNNCNGVADENYTTSITLCGEGVCGENTGMLICEGGAEVDTCDPTDGATEETCDALDNDCDGLVDDDGGEGSICGPIDTMVVCPDIAVSDHNVTLTYTNPLDSAQVVFECRMDGGEWFRCDGGTYATPDLTYGQHIFEVRAVDAAGNIDPSSATCVWSVDDFPPDTYIPVHPEDPTTETTAVFVFDANESPVVYFCVLDPEDEPPAPEAYADCNSTETWTGLPDGNHTIWVYAVDPAGNADPTPATYTWTIDTEVLDTVIDSGPANPSPFGEDSPFTYSEPNDPAHPVFECRLDGGDWMPCDGGATAYSGLPIGDHIFEVRACKPSTGVCDPTPAIYSWTIVDFICTEPLALTCSESYAVDAPADQCLWQGEVTATAVRDCRVELTLLADEDVYPVGTSVANFLATDDQNHSETCQTQVIVSDVTPPTVTCGTWNDDLGLVQAGAEDACGVTLTIEGVTCYALVDGQPGDALPAAECPMAVDGDLISFTGGIGAPFAVTYTVVGVDPSDNNGSLGCELMLDPDTDLDTIADSVDNCPLTPNEAQADLDLDGLGDLCDDTADGLRAMGSGCQGGGAAGGLPFLVLFGAALLAWRRRAEGAR